MKAREAEISSRLFEEKEKWQRILDGREAIGSEDIALAVSEQILSGKGAWRVHGGGFAGTIQAFVPDNSVEEYTSALKSIFGDDSCYVLSVRPFGGISLA